MTSPKDINELCSALKALRPRCKDRYGVSKLKAESVDEPDAVLYTDSAEDFATLVCFSVGVDADLYLAGKATLADLKQWDAKASR